MTLPPQKKTLLVQRKGHKDPTLKVDETNSVLILTGLSGSGKSLFLKALEDLGYETIDSLPLRLAEQAILEDRPKETPLAINLDTRSRHFSIEAVQNLLETLKKKSVEHQLVFLDSDPHILKRRYTETRRYHPLNAGHNLERSLEEERLLMQPLKEEAHVLVDTSLLTPPELKKFVRRHFDFKNKRELVVEVISFAFRRGVPTDANLVFDMRFLKNPYYDPSLRNLTGENSSVQIYLEDNPLFGAFLGNITNLLDTMLPAVTEEGRGSFMIAFGCSGGQHRSVVSAQAIYHWLKERGFACDLHHRELDTGL